MQERTVISGNNVISMSISDEKNENYLCIHNNDIGKTLYENHKVWDSDMLKIIRTIHRYENNHRVDFRDIIKIINKQCRHLKIILDF